MQLAKNLKSAVISSFLSEKRAADHSPYLRIGRENFSGYICLCLLVLHISPPYCIAYITFLLKCLNSQVAGACIQLSTHKFLGVFLFELGGTQNVLIHWLDNRRSNWWQTAYIFFLGVLHVVCGELSSSNTSLRLPIRTSIWQRELGF
jgi:hypothetical protein